MAVVWAPLLLILQSLSLQTTDGLPSSGLDPDLSSISVSHMLLRKHIQGAETDTYMDAPQFPSTDAMAQCF